MKYIVFWVLYSTHSIPCPQSDPVRDEFGRLPMYTTTTSMACFIKERVGLKQKVFYNLDSANIFYNRAKAIEGPDIDSVRLVSLKIR